MNKRLMITVNVLLKILGEWEGAIKRKKMYTEGKREPEKE